jgi:CTP synthase (UTP-ammonia lyase)
MSMHQRPETRIAIVGDYDPEREYHRATSEALDHAAAALGISLVGDWIPTDSLNPENASVKLSRYDAVFLAPGAPYRSSEGAFASIEFARSAAARLAREQGWPFFAT